MAGRLAARASQRRAARGRLHLGVGLSRGRALRIRGLRHGAALAAAERRPAGSRRSARGRDPARSARRAAPDLDATPGRTGITPGSPSSTTQIRTRDTPSQIPERPGLPVDRRRLARRDLGLRARSSRSVPSPSPSRPARPPDAAAWIFKSLAALAILGTVALATLLARRKALCRRARRMESVTCTALRRRRPQRRLDGATRDGGAGARRKRTAPAGGRLVGGGDPRQVGRGSSSSRCARSRPGHRGGEVGHYGFAAAALLVVAVASVQFGWHWLEAFGPLARNANKETSSRCHTVSKELGVPHGVASGSSRPGSPRVPLARTAGLARARQARARSRAAPLRDSVPRSLVRRLGGSARGQRGRPARAVARVAITAYLLRQGCRSSAFERPGRRRPRHESEARVTLELPDPPRPPARSLWSPSDGLRWSTITQSAPARYGKL